MSTKSKQNKSAIENRLMRLAGQIEDTQPKRGGPDPAIRFAGFSVDDVEWLIDELGEALRVINCYADPAFWQEQPDHLPAQSTIDGGALARAYLRREAI